jgi:uncharacterized UBP type Zn finger protein
MVPYGPEMSLGMRWVGPNGATPRCDHLDGLVPVPPDSTGCRECTAAGTEWAGLVTCLACGWVACSDDSPQRHAFAHYEETDHPVVRALRPGPAWNWCYVHRRTV